VSDIGDYPLPQGQLSLAGPVTRPATGTLPIRGDLAHIALANRFLVAHYVMPQPRLIAEGGAALLCHPRAGSDGVATLSAGQRIEVLDYSGTWCWACCGPEGPTGYLPIAQLAP
jgi:hypothetical protein